MQLRIIPVTFREACAFVAALHRHNGPPRGHKFSIGVADEHGVLHGVAQAGRPVARAYDPRVSIEVNRTCTDGTPNANSMLYGAVRRAAVAMGYQHVLTYTQHNESGASLRAAGFQKTAELPARGSWAEHSKKHRALRDPVGTGGVARARWEWWAATFVRPEA